MPPSALFYLLVLLTSTGAEYSASHRVEHLSVARRDIGVAVAGGQAYFAGGCKDTGSAYVCDEATATVDIFTAKGPTGTTALSEARGWPAACATGSKVVFAGGGTGGKVMHSTTADIFDVSSHTTSHEASALSTGRWGIACATAGDTIYFAGGKVILQGGGFQMTDVVDTFQNGTWGSASFRLSQARESMGAAVGHGSLIFAGGWVTKSFGADSVDTVDIFSKPSAPDGGAATAHLQSKSYWPGVATANNGDVYVVGSKVLDHFDGSKWVSSSLPDEMAGSASSSLENGGAVPAAHVPNNGVAVGEFVCFYGWQSKKLSAVYCYHTINATWSPAMTCTGIHRGGGIAAIDNTVMVAGGYDPDNKNTPTDIVDIFQINEAAKIVVV